jgi:hypothetical protein
MDRRQFMSTFAAFAAAAQLDPERLLWEPGKKTIVVPRVIRPEDRLLQALHNCARQYGLTVPTSAICFVRSEKYLMARARIARSEECPHGFKIGFGIQISHNALP